MGTREMRALVIVVGRGNLLLVCCLMTGSREIVFFLIFKEKEMWVFSDKQVSAAYWCWRGSEFTGFVRVFSRIGSNLFHLPFQNWQKYVLLILTFYEEIHFFDKLEGREMQTSHKHSVFVSSWTLGILSVALRICWMTHDLEKVVKSMPFYSVCLLIEYLSFRKREKFLQHPHGFLPFEVRN